MIEYANFNFQLLLISHWEMIGYKTSKQRKKKGVTLFEQAKACEFVNPNGCLRNFIKSFPQRRFLFDSFFS